LMQLKEAKKANLPCKKYKISTNKTDFWDAVKMSGVMLKTCLIKVRFFICLLDQKLPQIVALTKSNSGPPFPFPPKNTWWKKLRKTT
jgi:hypothetical protein